MSWGRTKPPAGAQVDWLHPTSRGLVACWPFNEGSGLKVQELVSQSYSTISATTVTWVPGPHGGRALDFPGTGAHALHPHSTTLSSPSDEISFSAWVYLDSAGNYPSVITKSGGASNWQYLFQFASTTRKICFQSQNINLDWAKTANTAVPLSTWTHIGASYKAGVIYYYFNGQPDGTQSVFNNPVVNQLHNLYLGARFDGFPMDGRIDLPMIWKRCVSAGEYLQHYVDPYAFLHRPKRRVYSLPASATGSPWYYNLQQALAAG